MTTLQFPAPVIDRPVDILDADVETFFDAYVSKEESFAFLRATHRIARMAQNKACHMSEIKLSERVTFYVAEIVFGNMVRPVSVLS